jgi:hypothetical protein
LLRKVRPIPRLSPRLRSWIEFREVTPVTLGDDLLRVARVPSFDTGPNVNDALSRCCRLAVQWMDFSLRLRSLHCSLLSQGVIATMNHSDSSCAPLLLLSPSESGSAERSRRATEHTRSPSVTHVSVPIIPTPATSRGYSCAGLRHPGRARPPVSAESRSLSFRADVWLGPFTAFLTEESCLCLLGVLLLHRSPGGI